MKERIEGRVGRDELSHIEKIIQPILKGIHKLHLRSHGIQDHPRAQAILEAVDFDALRVIIIEFARKSSGEDDIGEILLANKRDVVLASMSHDRMRASANPASRVIGIDAVAIYELGQEIPDELRDLLLLWTLIHEQTHVLAGENPSDAEPLASGYLRSSGGLLDAWTFFLFNEGVTEKITEKVFSEYVRRYGLPGCASTDALRFIRLRNERAILAPYAAAEAVIDTVRVRISASTGVPEDVVMNGIVRGYFRGLNLANDQIRTALDETFGELEFVRRKLAFIHY